MISVGCAQLSEFFLNYTVLFKSNANKKHKFHLHLRYQPISAAMVLINILAQWRPCLSRSSMKALLKKEQFLVQFEIVSMNAVKCREIKKCIEMIKKLTRLLRLQFTWRLDQSGKLHVFCYRVVQLHKYCVCMNYKVPIAVEN